MVIIKGIYAYIILQWIDMKWMKPVIHVLYYQVPVPDTTSFESTKIYLDGCCIHHNGMESTK